MLCIRCNEREAPDPLGLCTACRVHTRLEVAVGLRRLHAYLDEWASAAVDAGARSPDLAPGGRR